MSEAQAPDAPPAAESIPRFGSDVVARLLQAAGIEYAAINPGASFRGIHDSIVNFGGNRRPEVVTCLHEQIAVAIGHGYAIASGRPMATLLHDVVGLQQATVAIYSAWIDRVPMLVIGGTGPVDAARRRPWIDWIHTAQLQADLVRPFVKWDDQPGSIDAIPRSFARALAVATSAPAGPVYVCYDATLQEGSIGPAESPPTDLREYPQPSRLQADQGAIEEAAARLCAAEAPVLLTEYAGRYPGAAAALGELADVLGAPILVTPGRFNVASTHPLAFAGKEETLLAASDAILAVEVMDLFGYFHTGPERRPLPAKKPASWVGHLTLGDLGINGWSQDFQELAPLDLEIRADAGIALPLLVEACRNRIGRDTAARDARRTALTTAAAGRRRAIREDARMDRGALDRLTLSGAVADAVRDRDYVIARDLLRGSLFSLLDIDDPTKWIGANAGGGLGNGLGFSIGVPLGRAGHEVYIALLGDGDFLYTPNALWTAAQRQLPLVVAVANNRLYGNDFVHQQSIARHRGRSLERAGIGTSIDEPAPDLAAMARSFGAEGIGPVSTLPELRSALSTAVERAASGGGPVVVDVLTS